MILTILGAAIGALVLIAGLTLLVRERKDPESRKIYAVASVFGAAVAVFCIVRLILL